MSKFHSKTLFIFYSQKTYLCDITFEIQINTCMLFYFFKSIECEFFLLQNFFIEILRIKYKAKVPTFYLFLLSLNKIHIDTHIVFTRF